MTKEHHVVYIPGLHDQHAWNRTMSQLIPLCWRAYGFYGHIVTPHWEEGTKVQPKLNDALEVVDTLLEEGHFVSVIGQSAGGSLAGNVFVNRKDKLHGFINTTGRLREGVNVTPSLDEVTKTSPAFKESVLLFEHENYKKLTAQDKKRIMTIRPSYDSVVPKSTVSLPGATNIVSPIPGHSIGGVSINTFLAYIELGFLKQIAR